MADIGPVQERLKTEDKGNWLKEECFSSKTGNESDQAQGNGPCNPDLCAVGGSQETKGRFRECRIGRGS